MTRRVAISLLAATLLGGVAHAHPTLDVRAEPARMSIEDVTVKLAQSQISAAEAKRIARRQVPGGEVVDISRRGDVYRVRVVARSGRVVDVRIDARSGRVVG